MNKRCTNPLPHAAHIWVKTIQGTHELIEYTCAGIGIHQRENRY